MAYVFGASTHSKGTPSNPLTQWVSEKCHQPATETFGDKAPSPEEVGAESVVPLRERQTPVEHLSDFPAWEKTQNTSETPEQFHERHAQGTFDRDMAGHRAMGDGVGDLVEGVKEDGSKKRGFVEPERVRDARMQ